jgi:hypothetical protein
MASAGYTSIAHAFLRAGKMSGVALQQLQRQHTSRVPAQVIQLQQHAHRSSMTVAVEIQPALCQMPTACHICQLHSYLQNVCSSNLLGGCKSSRAPKQKNMQRHPAPQMQGCLCLQACTGEPSTACVCYATLLRRCQQHEPVPANKQQLWVK